MIGTGPVELGRQHSDAEAPYRLSRKDDGSGRVAVAPLEDRAVPRHQLLAEVLANGKVRLTNLSNHVRIGLSGLGELKPTECREVPLPAVLHLGNRTVRLQKPENRLRLPL